MPHKKDKKYLGIKDSSIVHEEIIQPSTLENIDIAFYDHINDKFNIAATTNKGWKKTPILWLTAERSYQIYRQNL